MKVSRDASDHLIVTSVETLIRILLGLAVLGIAVVWTSRATITQALGWTAVCAVFGLALTAANERSTFDFDRASLTLRWRQDTPFRHVSGEIPFSAITGLSIERDFKSASPARGRGGARRLVLLTAQGPIPFTTAFTGLGSNAADVGEEVRRYLTEALPGREIPFNAPL
ncbi:MAG TPA: hypothetical protein VF785_13930 [Gemmatimonadaceae bacterium]